MTEYSGDFILQCVSWLVMIECPVFLIDNIVSLFIKEPLFFALVPFLTIWLCIIVTQIVKMVLIKDELERIVL